MPPLTLIISMFPHRRGIGGNAASGSRRVLSAKIFLACCAALFAGTLFSFAASENVDSPAAAWEPAYPESAQKRFPGRFVTALVRGNGDDVWIATEKRGLFRMNHNEKGEWQWGSVRAGTRGFPPTKNFYALCRDGFGRIWAGTDSFGVAVFDGKTWRTFNRSNGFPGARVFSIACSPKNGDVAVAHDSGISVCAGTSGKWTHFSTLDGLPTNEPSSVRFSADGALWAGFSCGGVASASPENGYLDWKLAGTAWHFGGTKNLLYPSAATGEGLPSNLVNAVCPLADGRAACATAAGLAFTDEGGAWSFLRGADFPAKMKLLLNGRPKEVSLPDAETKKKLLPEDFVTCLVETDDGLWAGTRRKGCVLLDPANGFAPKVRADGTPARQLDGAWVKAILPISGETLLVGTYGNGLKTIRGNGLVGEPEIFSDESGNAPAFVFPTPTGTEIAALRERLSKEPRLPGDAPWAVFLGDDWETRGNWCERYGQRFAVLCAVYAPSPECRLDIDFLNYNMRGGIGKSARRDALRHWVHWINKPENENILFAPDSHMREEAEWDDHGEVYAFEQEGPDVWAFVTVPAGTQLVSLYFYNPNPEDWRAQYRDFFIEVRFQNDADTEGEVLARARVSDFAGSGVHKTFAVNSGGNARSTFAFRVCRNHSFNTILNGFFVSRLNEPREDRRREAGARFLYDDAIPRPPALDDFSEEDFPADALALWRVAAQAEGGALGLSARRHLRNLAYVSAKLAGTAPAEILENWRWKIGHWERSDKEKFVETMKEGWALQQKRHLSKNSADWYPYSPNVVPFTLEELRVMEHHGVDWKQYRPGGTPDVPVEEMRERVRPLIKPYFEAKKARDEATRKAAEEERRARERGLGEQ